MSTPPCICIGTSGKILEKLVPLAASQKGNWVARSRGDFLLNILLDPLNSVPLIKYSFKEKTLSHINYLFWVNLVIKFQDIKNTVLDPL